VIREMDSRLRGNDAIESGSFRLNVDWS
jgi:hypothetical protein